MPTTHDMQVGEANSMTSNGAKHVSEAIYLDFEANPVGSGDTVQFFPVAAGTRINAVTVYVHEAEGGTATIDIGDQNSSEATVDADGFINNADINATGYVSQFPLTLVEGAPNTFTPAYGMGKLFTEAGILTLLANNALDNAKITILVDYVYYGAVLRSNI